MHSLDLTHPITRAMYDLETGGEPFFSAANSDLYHVTTGQVLDKHMAGWTCVGNIYLRGGLHETFTVIGGLRYIIPALADFRFDNATIDWLKSLKTVTGTPRYNSDWLESKRGKGLGVHISLMPDGSIAFPGVIGRIEGPITECKWVDTIISNFLRRGSAVFTRAARLQLAAGGKIALADNAMRRAADLTGMMTADYAYAAGMLGSSNMRAAQQEHYAPMGTMDHWYVMAMMAKFFADYPAASTENEAAKQRAMAFAFAAFIDEYPNGGSLLLDADKTDIGLAAAIEVLKDKQPQNYTVRLDSGDFHTLAPWVRQELDNAGLEQVGILLSGGISAASLHKLVQASVPFVGAGVGGYLNTGSSDEPPVNVEIVTKVGWLKAPNWQAFYATKISDTPGKASLPGALERLRLLSNNMLVADVMVHAQASITHAIPVTSMRLDTHEPFTFKDGIGLSISRPIHPMLDEDGRLITPAFHELENIRRLHAENMAQLPTRYRNIHNGVAPVPVGIEESLWYAWRNMTGGTYPERRKVIDFDPN